MSLIGSSDRLAIVAGAGQLPLTIAAANPDALFLILKGAGATPPEGMEQGDATYEKLGALFKRLRKAGVTHVVFAGKVDRPKLNPMRMDMTTLGLFPRVKAVLGKGDDALLRLVAHVFEEQGFIVVSAKDVTDGLSVEAKIIGRTPTDQDQADATRAIDILTALDGQDVAQSAVVAGGQCLGIESIQGTDALLSYVATTPEHLKRGARGVFVKRPKQGQDARMDTPTIGPETVTSVAKAGLGGIVIPSRDIIVLEPEDVERLVLEHGLFLEIRG